jgi:superfamily I DNA/RNA helicase/RecB family exonuclease
VNVSAKSQWPAHLWAAITAELDHSQVIIGAAGSGKTTLLIERATHLVTHAGLHPDQVRLLTPSRTHATGLRDLAAQAIPRATRGPWARSVSSLAFSIVAADHVAQGLPVPTLRSGADIDEDIRGLLGESAGGVSPFEGLFEPIVLATETFRTELRELMARVIEYGATPADLVAWGETYGFEQWRRAGAFMADYQQVIARSRPTSFEPAEMITRAAAIIDRGLPAEWADLRVVLVDDSHDIPASARRLITALTRWGVSVTAVGDPDVAGQTFRGSDPEAPAQLADQLGVSPVFATEVFRHGPTIRQRVGALSDRVGSARAGQQRQGNAVGKESGHPVIHLLSGSATEEDTAIAHYIAHQHLHNGIPLDQFAVVSRRAGALEGVARALGHRDLASYRSTRAALSAQPAARELLWWAEAALNPQRVSPERVLDMLRGVYGGWSALELRRLTTWVRVREAAEKTGRSAAVVIRDAVVGSEIFVDAPDFLAKNIDRTRAIIQAVRRLGADTSVDVVLSTLWGAVGVEDGWRTRCDIGGEGARFAAQALDAVVALMETASRFADTHPGVTPDVFITRVLAQDVAEDVLVPEPLLPAVWLGTASAAASRQWSVVIMHSVNEGVWPNTSLRGSLLGAPQVSWVARGVSPHDIDQRRVVLDDEIRMATLAASRASLQLVVSAVSADDTSPSPLFFLLAEGTPRWSTDGGDSGTLRERVGDLRRQLATGPDESTDRAVTQLAYLATRGVVGSSPEHWWGLHPQSTTAPLFANDIVRLSPSRVADIEQSPLMWLLDTIAPEPLPPVVDVGAIIHRALEENPWGPLEAMAAVVDQRWSEVTFDAAWLSEAKRFEAHRQLAALDQYLADQKNEHIELVGSEKRFQIDLPGSTITGVMDRLVKDADGNLLVVDLKTGRHKTDAQVVDDPQLLAYQLAVTTPEVTDSLGVDPAPTGGAYLLYVSSGLRGKPYRIALQPPLDEAGRAQFVKRLEEVREVMARAQFALGEGDSRASGRAPRHRWHLIGQVCGD